MTQVKFTNKEVEIIRKWLQSEKLPLFYEMLADGSNWKKYNTKLSGSQLLKKPNLWINGEKPKVNLRQMYIITQRQGVDQLKFFTDFVRREIKAGTWDTQTLLRARTEYMRLYKMASELEIKQTYNNARGNNITNNEPEAPPKIPASTG